MPRHVFTKTESETIERMRDKGRASWPEIAAALGVTTAPVMTEYRRIEAQRHLAAVSVRSKRGPRLCLGGCREMFDSDGAGNRICENCAGRTASPFEPDGPPGRWVARLWAADDSTGILAADRA